MGTIDPALVGQVRAVLAADRPWAVTQVGQSVLRRPAAAYDGQLPDDLLHALLDAMRAHLPGVGVGIAAARERVPQPLLELINPVITAIGEERRSFYEGCLSVSGLTAVVPRWHRVRLSAIDRVGSPYDLDLTGWPAGIAQHETDHLAGVLYVDRAEPRSLSTLAAFEQHWAQPTPSVASAALGFEV